MLAIKLALAAFAGSWSLNVEVEGQVYVLDTGLTFEDCQIVQKALAEHEVAKQWPTWCEEEVSWSGHFGRLGST